MQKRYFWLKLRDSFFDEIYIKALRAKEDGDTLVVIYLKMALLSLKTDVTIPYGGYFKTFESELANALNEDEEKVCETVKALLDMKAIETTENGGVFMSAISDCIGSECASAERVRKHRDAQKNKAVTATMLQCNKNVTTDIDIEIDIRDKRYNISSSQNKKNSPQIDYQNFVDSFNSTCTSLPKVKTITDKRKKSISKAVELLGNIKQEDFFCMVENSDFLTGRTGTWRGCCFDWITKPSNLVKIIEGNYENKSNKLQTTAQLDYNESIF